MNDRKAFEEYTDLGTTRLDQWGDGSSRDELTILIGRADFMRLIFGPEPSDDVRAAAAFALGLSMLIPDATLDLRDLSRPAVIEEGPDDDPS